MTYIIIAVVVFFYLWSTYNRCIVGRNQVQEDYSDIDIQLKRRSELIDQLASIVKGYAKHEKELFENVTKARSEAMRAKGPAEAGKAENMLTDTLKSLFAVAENYPQLQASENFQKLQDELTDTENKVEAARRFYNGNVRDFNTKIQIFPNSMVAGMVSAKAFELFVAAGGEKETPQVKF